MPDKKFDLGDYIEVKDRIARFYELFGQGRLVTTNVTLTSEPDGKPRVWVEAAAYRTPDDPQPGRGNSWMELPGTTNYTRGSEIENAETSAWGRAIGSLGILIEGGIASAQEVQNKQGDDGPRTHTGHRDGNPGAASKLTSQHDGGLIGIAEVGTARDSDFELRESPEGWSLGFRLKGDKGGIKVLARDALALGLAGAKDDVIGQLVTCWGRISDETFTPANTTKKVTYQVLQLERITAPAFVFPGPVSEGGSDPSQGDLNAMADDAFPAGQEALLGLTDDEKAAIGAGLPG